MSKFTAKHFAWSLVVAAGTLHTSVAHAEKSVEGSKPKLPSTFSRASIASESEIGYTAKLVQDLATRRIEEIRQENEKNTSWNTQQKETVKILADILEDLSKDPLPKQADGKLDVVVALTNYRKKIDRLDQLGQLEKTGRLRSLSDMEKVLAKTAGNQQEYSQVIAKIGDVAKLLNERRSIERLGHATLGKDGKPTFTERSIISNADVTRLFEAATRTREAANSCPVPGFVAIQRQHVTTSLQQTKKQLDAEISKRDLLVENTKAEIGKLEKQREAAKAVYDSANKARIDFTRSPEFRENVGVSSILQELVFDAFDIRPTQNGKLTDSLNIEPQRDGKLRKEALRALSEQIVLAHAYRNSPRVAPVKSIEGVGQRVYDFMKRGTRISDLVVQLKFESGNQWPSLLEKPAPREFTISVKNPAAFERLSELVLNDSDFEPAIKKQDQLNATLANASKSFEQSDKLAVKGIAELRKKADSELKELQGSIIPGLELDISRKQDQLKDLAKCEESFNAAKLHAKIGQVEAQHNPKAAAETFEKATKHIDEANAGIQSYTNRYQGPTSRKAK